VFDFLFNLSCFREFWVSAQKPPGDYKGPPGDAPIVHDFSRLCDEPLGGKEGPPCGVNWQNAFLLDFLFS